MINIKPEAEASPHSNPDVPMNAIILGGRGMASVVAMIEAKVNSFQVKIKQNPAVAAIPPLTIGTSIFINA